MLSVLQDPVVIAIIVIVLLVLIAIPVLLRRRRAAREEVLPPPELGQSIDYTSLPYEEPTGLMDRLRQSSPAAKLLLGLVPLVIIVAAVVLVMTFVNAGSGGSGGPTPTLELPTITNITATLAGPTKIIVTADTTLPDGATVTAAMKQGDAEFAWFNKDSTSAQVSDKKIKLQIEKLKDAPKPSKEPPQTITLVSTANGQPITSESVPLQIPQIYQAAYYGEAPAPTVAPTVAPTTAAAQPTAAPAEPTAAPAEPTAAPQVELKATVFNGGNIRKEPRVTNNSADVLGQLHAGEVVVVLEKTPDRSWYRVKAPEAEGWVSATLLTIDAKVAEQVPTQAPPSTGLTAKVFNGGNVRERPVTGKPLDQINAGETVDLIAKTADGGWYQIKNSRGVTGWVSRTLLTIDPQVAKQVPVAR